MDKSNMLRTVTAFAALFMASEGFAAGGGADLEPAGIDPKDAIAQLVEDGSIMRHHDANATESGQSAQQ